MEVVVRDERYMIKSNNKIANMGSRGYSRGRGFMDRCIEGSKILLSGSGRSIMMTSGLEGLRQRHLGDIHLEIKVYHIE